MEEIILPKIQDARERARAIDPTESFIVQAPAGSGKTELLIRRFLVLLSLAKKPEEILAITFTRKAAGEMHSRVFDSLLRASRGESGKSEHDNETLKLARKVLEEDKRRGWGILVNPSRLKVQTIDSICASLVKAMPVLSRTGSAPSATEDATEIFTEAARRVTDFVENEGRDGESLRAALSHLDNNAEGLIERIVAFFMKRDQWLRHADKGRELTRKALEGVIKEEIEDGIKRVSALITDAQFRELSECARHAAANLITDGKADEITILKDMNGPPGSRSSALKTWRAVATLFLTKGNAASWRKSGGINKRLGFPLGNSANTAFKKRFIDLLDELTSCGGLLEALRVVRSLPDERFTEDEWGVLGALVHLMPLSLKMLATVFAEKGKVDFTSVSISALDALGPEDAPTDLMLHMDLRLKHILVDEYQDTSYMHSSLLKSLTSGWSGGDGRTLFLVGDPMQSIYLFREAEVGLFLDAVRDGVGEVKLTKLVLKTNFRSSPEIVSWVNKAFSDAFPEVDDTDTGRVSYAPSLPFKESTEGSCTCVSLYEEYDAGREARDVIESVERIRGANPAETIAVLARSKSHLTGIVELLMSNGIDFQTKDLVPLGSRPVVGDLLSVTRALRHPFDRVAWLALLRAPFSGLELADIHSLSSGASKYTPISALINDPAALTSLSVEGQERIKFFAKRVGEALLVRGRVSERRLVEGLWISLGGPACLKDKDAVSYAESYLDKLGSMEDASTEAIEAAVQKLFTERTGLGDNPVEVMTMHGAKGLEYDHIFLPALGREPRKADKPLLLWHEKRDAILLAPIERRGRKDDFGGAIYNFIWDKKMKKERSEYVRLLYVAATRARKGLYLFGHIKEKAGGERLSPKSTSLLSCISGVLDEGMFVSDNGSEALDGKSAKERSQTVTQLKLKRLARSWAMPTPLSPPDICVSVEDIEGEGDDDSVSPEFNWSGEVARHIGTLVHAYLQRISRDGVPVWSRERVLSEKGRMVSMLRGAGLSTVEAGDAGERCAKMIINALGDDIGLWILSGGGGEADDSDGTEFQVSGVIDGRIVHRTIDRRFVDSDGVHWIIDYKTGTHAGGDTQHFLSEEKKRYAPQLDEYRTLMSALYPDDKIKTALYYPALLRLIEV